MTGTSGAAQEGKGEGVLQEVLGICAEGIYGSDGIGGGERYLGHGGSRHCGGCHCGIMALEKRKERKKDSAVKRRCGMAVREDAGVR